MRETEELATEDLLAQCGNGDDDERIERMRVIVCYYYEHGGPWPGSFTWDGSPEAVASGVIATLSGRNRLGDFRYFLQARSAGG